MTQAGLIVIGILQVLLLLLAAPLLSGFVRVTRAKIQSRKGPPLLQNYRDIAKLMKRQEVVSEQAGWIFRITPNLTLSCMILVALLIPLIQLQSPLGMVGDLIVVVYLFALPRFLFALSGLESGSTFTGIGARRELLISSLIEPSLVLAVFVVALLAGSTNLGTISTKVATGEINYSMGFLLSMIAFAFATYVEMGKLPFDLAEAEQEIQEGPLSEYSGKSLAIMKWSIYLKQLVLVALFFSLFLPFGSMEEFTLSAFLLALITLSLKVILFYLIVAVIENVMARMRFMKTPAATWLALGAAVLSFVFYLANV